MILLKSITLEALEYIFGFFLLYSQSWNAISVFFEFHLLSVCSHCKTAPCAPDNVEKQVERWLLAGKLTVLSAG